MNAETLDTEALETQSQTNARVARASGVLALGNILSRVLGLGREVVIANLFGVSGATDAFRVAVLVPKALYDLLIGGHVNSAIIPVFSEIVALQGRAALWRLVSILLTIITLVLSLLVLLLIFFAEPVVTFVGGGYSAPTLSLAAHLLRLTAPALIFLSIFAVLSGALYALRSFSLPALAGAVFNGGIVLVALIFAPPPQVFVFFNGAASPTWVLSRPPDGIGVVALGWVVGALAQVLLLLPGLRDGLRHLRPTLRWRQPAVLRIGTLYIPVMFSLILDTLVIRTFSYNLASQTGEGSISYMDLATTLIQFPQGLIATAISVAILPTLSRQMAAFGQGSSDQPYKDTLGLGLRLTLMLILPAAVGLFVLATPAVQLLFEHGAFSARDTDITTQVLRLYLLGLPFAAIDLLLVYAFYARQDTLTPALIGTFSLTLYMVVALLLVPTFGLFSLMLADSAKHLTHALLSLWFLRRRMAGFGEQRLPLTLLKTGAAAGGMGILMALLLPLVDGWIAGGGLLGELLLLVLVGGGGTAGFALLAALLRVEEWRWLLAFVRHRAR